MPFSDDIREQINALYESVGEFLYPEPAQWERGFRLDTFPRQEIAVWHRIAAAWERYCENHGLTSAPAPEARRIIGALAGISMGANPCEGPNSIDEHTARELCELYLNPQ